LVIACSRAAEDDAPLRADGPVFFLVATAMAVSSSGKSLFN